MNETVKVKIAQVGKKQQPSKFKPGETYTIATVMDTLTGRKASAFGAWTDTWKVGDEIDAIWKENKWTDKDGFEQVGWNLENPNKKTYAGPRGGGFAAKPSIVDAYTIAAALAPLLYAGKKKVMFDDIVKLADAVNAKFETAASAVDTTTQDTVKSIDVNTEVISAPAPIAPAAPATTVISEIADDGDDPF